MDYADKIARYEEIERRGLLSKLPQEKQELWAEYKRRQNQPVQSEQMQKSGYNPNVLGKVGTIDRGLTFGLGRKAGGLINAIGSYPVDRIAELAGVKNTPSFMDRYHEIVDPTMQAINEFHKDRPVEATALELGAGILNPANKFGVGYIAKGGNLASKAARSGIVGSGAGGVAGALNTENTEELPVNVASGVGIGGALGGALPIAANRVSAVYNALKSIVAPEASVAGKATGLQNIVKDNNSVRALSRGIMADDDVATQVLKEAPSEKARLNEELTDILNKTTGRKLDIEGAKQNADEAYRSYVAQNADYPIYNTKTPQEQAADNFARWFESSQIVDENGQPRRYYHGSLRKFDEFKQANNDYNFAPDEKFAYNYAESKGFEQGIDAEPQLYEVFLNSKKPFDFENPEDIKNLSNYIKGKQIRVFGNPKKEEEFLRNLKGEYYDTKLDEGEFEKLLSDKYNKWYSPDNHDVNYEQSSVNTDKIFSVNPDEEYFITGSAPWGYNIDDVKPSQIEDAIKNLDFGKNKRHQIPVDIETPYGNRVINIDLKRIDKPSAKNLKRGADNWIDIESADFDGEDLLDALKNMGYDGYYKQENGVKNLSVFNPNQIKSVNNSGAWSSSPSLSDAGWKPQSSLRDIVGQLNEFKQNAMNKALAEGAAMSDYGAGSLDAVHKAQGVLNDMIENSFDKSVLGVKRPTTETSELMGLKQVFNNMLEPSGVKPFDARISKAKSLEYFRDMGYKFKPSEKKFEDLGIKTLRDKRAFLQGRLQAILDNVKDDKNLAKAIRADENTLKKLMPRKKFEELLNKTSEIDREYTRLNKFEQLASRELDKPIAADRPMSERSESKLSYLGSLYDKANALMWQNSNRRRALALLNGGDVNPEMWAALERLARRYQPQKLTPYLAEYIANNQ